jgi:Flp pilus assembly protein TadG
VTALRSLPERRDRGAAEAYGLVLLAPAVIGLALLVVSLGRSVESEAQVRTAAEAAAQAGALERTHRAARSAAQRVAAEMLVDDATCSDRVVSVPNAPARGVGMSAGMIEVTISCTVPDDGVDEVQESDIVRSATAYATVDQFRAGG